MSNSVQQDIDFVKSILPSHYTVREYRRRRGDIFCTSPIGIVKPPYKMSFRDPVGDGYRLKETVVTDHEDVEHWEYIFKAIKQHFADRFMEVFHQTCTNHITFIIHLKVNQCQTNNTTS